MPRARRRKKITNKPVTKKTTPLRIMEIASAGNVRTQRAVNRFGSTSKRFRHHRGKK